MTNPKKKIVVLGGGVAAMTAVFEITSLPNWQDTYEITVYQMGWRLGGKGASGRNMSNNARIEEHGLHIWFGFYENAFNAMWRCYNELGRSPNAPLSRVQDAFVGQDTHLFTEYINGEWLNWQITFPHDSDFPGIPNADGRVTMLPSLWAYLQRLINFAFDHYSNKIKPELRQRETQLPAHQPSRIWEQVKKWVGHEVDRVAGAVQAAFLKQALVIIEKLDSDIAKHSAHDHNVVLELLREFKEWLDHMMDGLSTNHTELRRAWIMVDLALTCAIGMIADGVLIHGFDVINNYDFREWMKKHAGSDTMLDSVIVRTLYDIFFAYENGDTEKPNVEAGSALRGSLRTALTYKGHVLYKMNAGMGDTIFGPYYQVLRRRGVNFKFFHRVTEIIADGDQPRIKTVKIARQVDVIGEEYEPLVLVNDLPCWPTAPLYDQLVQGGELRQNNINLESRWAKWDDVGEVVLDADNGDFDHVILGIALAGLYDICADLIKKNAAWQKLVANVKTVQTQSVQLWFKPTADEIKYAVPHGLVGGYVEPLASWSDFSQLDPRENWPAGVEGSQYYTTAVKKEESDIIPPPSDHNYPAQELQKVRDQSQDFLQHSSKVLWQNGALDSGELKWDLLTAPDNLKGTDRLWAQYFRVNIDPTERYELTLKGTTVFRLQANQSGFDNLIITGAWINNGFNLGCVEAATMSGMLAARALTGDPKHIVGETDLPVSQAASTAG